MLIAPHRRPTKIQNQAVTERKVKKSKRYRKPKVCRTAQSGWRYLNRIE